METIKNSKYAILLILGLFIACKKAVVQPINLGNEVDFSSPILSLGESWTGTMGGLLEVSSTNDTINGIIQYTVKNISNKKLCWSLSEPHLKNGTQTAGELGPDMMGDLAPGNTVSSQIKISLDPKFTNYLFDGYVIHMEVYDCSGGIPLPYPGGN